LQRSTQWKRLHLLTSSRSG